MRVTVLLVIGSSDWLPFGVASAKCINPDNRCDEAYHDKAELKHQNLPTAQGKPSHSHDEISRWLFAKLPERWKNQGPKSDNKVKGEHCCNTKATKATDDPEQVHFG